MSIGKLLGGAILVISSIVCIISFFIPLGDFTVGPCEFLSAVFLAIIISFAIKIDIDEYKQYRRSFRYALKSGNLAQCAKKLLESGGDINSKDVEGVTILYIASQAGDYELVQWLVEHGADVNEKTLDGDLFSYVNKKLEKTNRQGGDAALQIAVKSGNLDIAKYLIEHGADSQDVLISAAELGNLERIQWPIEQDANILKNGESALYSAAEYDNWEIVQWLVEQGVNLQTALNPTAENGNLEMVQWLVKKGADINAKMDDGETALHAASKNGHWETAQWLIENGADINAKDMNGKTVLIYAAQKEQFALIPWLIEHGAKE